MCGYFYSNTVLPKNADLENIRRRGPDGFQVAQNELGNFVHSLLVTKPPRTSQPTNSTNKYGTMLYNGSIYNVDGNDTVWLTAQLDDNMDHCVQVIKSLRGEFSLTWVTSKFVLFCTDQWVTRNLWFYFSQEENTLSISSTPDVLRKQHIGAWPCQPNKIYIVEKTKATFAFWTKPKLGAMRTIPLTEWNLDQKTNNYDLVFEEFERAVDLRMDARHALGLSSGYDSAVIACALLNNVTTHRPRVYCMPKGENPIVLKQRFELHRASLVRDRPFREKTINDFTKLTRQPYADTTRINNFQLICDWGIERNVRIHLTGRGGDEIYGDYGFQGKQLTRGSQFGGYWPNQLDLVWPWHTGRSFLLEAVTLQDFAFGYWGCEARVPLLDQALVQAWLNTTNKLKNARYKGWMAEYMDMYHYPFNESDKKLSGFGS